MKHWLLLCCLWLFHPALQAGLVETYTIRAPESENDKRYQYDREVLRLALEKTVAKYGAYQLMTAPPMNFPRAVASVEADTYPNFFIKHTYEKRLNDRNLDYALFPVDLGIVGYRVCFVSDAVKEKVESAVRFSQIRRFTHGQGTGWSDVSILRHHGMFVREVAKYENLFTMVAHNRFDLFCRGPNELLDEWESHKHIKGLDYDTSMSIAYALPRFLYTHKKNQKAIQRVQEGLVTAYNDGSLLRLWKNHYGPSIEFAQLEKRRIHHIENPNLAGIKSGYEMYLYDPLKPPSDQ